MSEGSGEPGREPDPWSRPADFGEPGSTAPAPGDQPTAPPDPWSAPSPAASGDATQPGSPGGTVQPPPTPNGFSPGGADPWATQAGGQYPPPAGQYPPSGQYGYQQSPYYPPGGVPRNNPLAIAALVCGIAQFVLGLLIVGNILLAIPAVICGALGLRQINQRGERGRGMAIAGLVLGILGVAYFVIIVLVIIIGVSVRSH